MAHGIVMATQIREKSVTANIDSHAKMFCFTRYKHHGMREPLGYLLVCTHAMTNKGHSNLHNHHRQYGHVPLLALYASIHLLTLLKSYHMGTLELSV